MPHGITGQQEPSWKSCGLNCKSGWKVPGDTPKVLCFVARALSSGPGIISPLTWVAAGAVVCSARTGRKLAGGGTPTLRIQGDEVTFQTFSTPGVEQCWGVGNLVSLKLGLCGSGYCGFISRGAGSTGPRRGSSAGTFSAGSLAPCPSSLRTRAAQPPCRWHQPNSQRL